MPEFHALLLAATLALPLGPEASKPAVPTPVATNLLSVAPAPVPLGATNLPAVDPVEQAYEGLLAEDDRALAEIDEWLRQADALGASADAAALEKKVDDRIAAMDRRYREFLRSHPNHARARVAFGSFLNDTGRESEAAEEWERSRELDPGNPAIYNNLAGIYCHRGPVTNAFVCLEKAIELDPREPVYYQNLATAVFLYRRDVMEHYGMTNEQHVFDKSLKLYRQALELKPDSFVLATELAQTFYGVKPPRHAEALDAWRRAYELASDDLERDGIRIHLARVQVQAGRFDEARTNLGLVTDPRYGQSKERILKTLERKEQERGPAPVTEATLPPAAASPATPLPSP